MWTIFDRIHSNEHRISNCSVPDTTARLTKSVSEYSTTIIPLRNTYSCLNNMLIFFCEKDKIFLVMIVICNLRMSDYCVGYQTYFVCMPIRAG